MLGDYQQTRLSEYARIYDILIPRDHIFRRMNEEIDFSFVRSEACVYGHVVQVLFGTQSRG